MRNQSKRLAIEIFAVFISVLIFWVPLYFVFINALKDASSASELSIAWPSTFHLWDNLKEVIETADYMLVRALYNSTLITVLSVVLMVLVCAMAGFVMHRRQDKFTPWIQFIIFAGLVIPPAIVPTIWVLNNLGLFKSLTGIVLVEVALGFPYGFILYRSFMAGIPREIDEAAIIDGCGGFSLFFRIILPLLQPVTATTIIASSVGIFNDFVNPLYFFPGMKNVTIQVTLYNFMGRYVTQYNLLFMNILVITVPLLILFIFFNNKIVSGMTAGSVKG